MSKITTEDIIAHLHGQKAELLDQLSKIESALSAFGVNSHALAVSAAPTTAKASTGAKRGPKPRVAGGTSDNNVKVNMGLEPKRGRRGDYTPKATYEETKSLTDKIIYALASLQEATVKDLVEYLKTKEEVIDESKLANNVSQYTSTLRKKNIIKQVSKDGREYRYMLGDGSAE